MPKRKDYKVGFCKPPRHSRFKPGQCGNPRGRPRRSRNIDTIMREALYQTVQITRDGKTVRVPAFEALLLRLMKGGLEGDPRSTASLLKIATLLHDIQSRQAAQGDDGDAGASAPLEEVDKEVLRHFAELIRDGAFDEDGGEGPT